MLPMKNLLASSVNKYQIGKMALDNDSPVEHKHWPTPTSSSKGICHTRTIYTVDGEKNSNQLAVNPDSNKCKNMHIGDSASCHLDLNSSAIKEEPELQNIIKEEIGSPDINNGNDGEENVPRTMGCLSDLPPITLPLLPAGNKCQMSINVL